MLQMTSKLFIMTGKNMIDKSMAFFENGLSKRQPKGFIRYTKCSETTNSQCLLSQDSRLHYDRMTCFHFWFLPVHDLSHGCLGEHYFDFHLVKNYGEMFDVESCPGFRCC